jgi:hypothetical protein
LSSRLLSKNVKIRIYKTVILPVVLTLREKHRLRVINNKVLKIIFGPKRGDLIGGWRKLYNEELQNFSSSPSKIRMIKSRRMRVTGHVA